MIEKRSQLAVKAESPEGTAATLTVTEMVLANAIKFTPSIEIFERNLDSVSLSPYAAVPGKRSATLEFDMELKPSGAAGTAPALGLLLQGCGLGETIVTSTSVTYKPASSAIPSLTLAAYEDGIIHTLWGCRGNARLILENGKPGQFHFVFTGADFTTVSGALLAPTYETTVPPAFLAAQLLLDSYAAMLGKIEIDLGNQVVLRQSVNKSSGHFSAVIASRKPTISIDPEKVTVATYNWYGVWRSGAQGALTTALGSGAGKVITITAPKVQYSKIVEAANAGLRTLGIDGLLDRNTGDDELSIAIT